MRDAPTPPRSTVGVASQRLRRICRTSFKVESVISLTDVHKVFQSPKLLGITEVKLDLKAQQDSRQLLDRMTILGHYKIE
jgi:hypothetical protein